MDSTVDQTAAEREPAFDDSLVHYDPADGGEHVACGLRLRGLGRDTYSPDPAAVDCPPCRDVLDRWASPLATTNGKTVVKPASSDAGALTDEQMDAAIGVLADHLDGEPDLEALDAVLVLERWRDGLAGRRITITWPDGRTESGALKHVIDRGWDTPQSQRIQVGMTDGRSFLVGYRTPITVEPAQAEPERRTVGLEVLTDELRALANDERVKEARRYGKEPADVVTTAASVGIVLRTGDAPVGVPEVDTDWYRRFGAPPDRLGQLLRQARMYADGLDGQAGAELLMPGPDVLAALAGRPVGAYTAVLSLRADQVQPGWLVVGFANVADELLVRDVGDCADPTCPWGADCHVIQAEGVDPVHFAAWQSLQVRIPANEELAR